MKKIKFKILYWITYYHVSYGKGKKFYGMFDREQRKQIAKSIVNDYLNGW